MEFRALIMRVYPAPTSQETVLRPRYYACGGGGEAITSLDMAVVLAVAAELLSWMWPGRGVDSSRAIVYLLWLTGLRECSSAFRESKILITVFFG